MANIVKSEINLNEQDTLQDMLDTEKQVLDRYLFAIKESSAKNLRTFFLENLKTASDDEYTVFKQMQEKGYYVLKFADERAMEQTAKEYKKILKGIAKTE